MKTKRKHIVRFILLVLVAHSIGLIWFYAQENPLEENEQKLNNASGSTFVMGNSRAWFAVNDNQEVINLSSLGESSVYTYYQVKHALEVSQPVAVVIPVSVTDIYATETHYTNRDYCWRKHINYTEIGRYEDRLFEGLAFDLKRKIFPYSLLINWKIEETPLFQEDSLSYLHLTPEGRSDMAQQMFEGYEGQLHFADSVSLIYLSRTIELCQQHQVPLAGVQFPLTPEYRAATANHIDSSRNQALQTLINEHAVQVLDFENLYDDHPEYFRDLHHLNGAGAKAFTTILTTSLQAL